jgi:hypothetical protein
MPRAQDTAEQKELLDGLPLTQTAAAYVIGYTPRFLRDNSAPRQADGTYRLLPLVAWALERAKQNAVSDPLLVGDSPNLERYRKAKAELAEMDAAERRNQLIDVSALCDWWLCEVAAPLRQAIALLAKTHGEDASQVVTDALEKAIEAVSKREPESTAGDPKPAAVGTAASEAAADSGMGES